ncbi:CapA family protein [Natribacillus halophilus]|uniref:TupA-like ATPgrasp n=1 Tax=Natribacillus halophilus TaxID=549003 RepID=A0A1G8SE23_9BACI|nr:CapA family protein [Natribacillus halophilus]SDJ27403.1 TupA-like ATPgrasp [Natribacillus halophilus]
MAQTLTLTFAGDTSLGEYYVRKQGRENILQRVEEEPFSFFKKTLPILKGTDQLILNLETVLAKEPGTPLEGKEYPNWDQPDTLLPVLKDLGVSAVSLANNHTMDFGSELMLDTKKRLEDKGIKCFGAGGNRKEAAAPFKVPFQSGNHKKNVYILTGMRASKRYRVDYGFLAQKEEPGVNSMNPKRMQRQIEKIRSEDSEAFIIVCPHWQGQDYKWASNHTGIRERCHDLINMGANLILAHGTHMADTVEKLEGGTIVYSIGNYVFNTPGRYTTKQALPYSLMVKLHITEQNGQWTFETELYPIVTDNKRTEFNVRPVNKSEIDLVKQALEDQSRNVYYHLLQKDNCYYLKPVPVNENAITTNTNISLENDVKDYLFGSRPLNTIDITSDNAIDNQITKLGEVHQELDQKFREYYDYLLTSKKMKARTEQNDEHYNKLSRVVKRDYLSHAFLKGFERRKLNVEKSVSFRDIMVEQSQLRRFGFRGYSWLLDKKNRGYEFADNIKLPRPSTNNKIYSFSDIEPQSGPVVVKPVHSTGSMGVYLVYDTNTIFSAREGTWLNSWEELVNNFNSELKSDRNRARPYLPKDQWMIEELINSPDGMYTPPPNLKFYCFYGEVVLIFESNQLDERKVCYWDTDMNLVQTGRFEDQFYRGSGFSREELQMVADASLEIPSPFVRLDMLKGERGLYFGEITPRPGRFHTFNDTYDRILGEAYRKAEARIIDDLLHGKEFNAFTEAVFHKPSLAF